MPLVLEGLVSTLDADGTAHLAPMGPHVPGLEFDRFTLRPFPSSQTFRNLQAHGEGVLHVTDNVLLLAQAAIGSIDPAPEYEPAEQIRGWVLRNCCRFLEFQVVSIDESAPRVRIEAVVVRTARRRDFFGFNRAKHAILEAAILATRIGLIPHAEIAAEYRRLGVIVQKTGGPDEIEALAILQAHLNQVRGA